MREPITAKARAAGYSRLLVNTRVSEIHRQTQASGTGQRPGLARELTSSSDEQVAPRGALDAATSRLVSAVAAMGRRLPLAMLYLGIASTAFAAGDNSVELRGSWGSDYVPNLLLTSAEVATSEDQFILFLQKFEARPSVPWYVVKAMNENDLRSFYRNMKSLNSETATAIPRPEPPPSQYNFFAPPDVTK